MKKRWIKFVPVVIAVAALGVYVFTSLVMLLWNNILPAVLHVGTITFWQAAGILLLCKILFGGFRGRRGMHGGWRRKMMFGKWQNMTDEEKEMFRSRHACGHWHNAASC